MNRNELLGLITVQNLVLLILSFGWLWFFPNPQLLGDIRFEARLLWSLPVAVGLLVAGALAIRWIPALRAAHQFLDHEIFRHLLPSDGLYLGLLTGVAEELMFRGLLQNAWGLLPASLCFGVLHLPGLRHWAYAVWATLMSLVLGGLYLLTDNLLLVMLVHIINNTLALVLWPRMRKWYREEV
ncbi:MAG TPA: CPBP family intramembrane glutamic endopeptidase [Candidatus Obscuribacterales bacterium]